jgi:hypothetical protein
MPKGQGRPAQGGHRKLLRALQRSQALASEMRASDVPSTMHRGYEYERDNRKMLDQLGRQTDADFRFRQQQAERERKMIENEKRRRAEPDHETSSMVKAGRRRGVRKLYKV